jgi:protein-tyrosine phosphatase
MVDVHTHVLPAVDDGAADLDEAVRGVGTLAREGVSTVVATPHFRASVLERPEAAEALLWRFDESYGDLERAIADVELAVSIARGAEVLLDAPAPDLSDPRLRLGGTRFVLAEFMGFRVPAYAENQLAALSQSGWAPVLAHAERYAGLAAVLDGLPRWKESGARLQVNCGSLVGRFGPQAQRMARELLARGLADYLASDFHCRGEPEIERAVSWLKARPGGEEAVRLLTVDNPGRMLDNEDPLPVPPVTRDGTGRSTLWRRLFRRGSDV